MHGRDGALTRRGTDHVSPLSEGGDGNPGGPGLLTTDVTDPLGLTFHVLDKNSGWSTSYSLPLTVHWNPLTSADSTNQNPVPNP
jgi:hypothetical protein